MENKKLETRLKHIEKDRQRTTKQLANAKNRQVAAYHEPRVKQSNDGIVHLLSENPAELKQKIRDKRGVYEEHQELLEELKLKVKGDNLLLLSNQCIYQQKLLLNKKQTVDRLTSSGSEPT